MGCLIWINTSNHSFEGRILSITHAYFRHRNHIVDCCCTRCGCKSWGTIRINWYRCRHMVLNKLDKLAVNEYWYTVMEYVIAGNIGKLPLNKSFCEKMRHKPGENDSINPEILLLWRINPCKLVKKRWRQFQALSHVNCGIYN